MTAQTILPANSVVDSGFNVDNSCRFDGSSSYLQKTYVSSQNKKFSISTWIKRSSIGDAGAIWSGYHNATNYITVAFKDDDTLRFQNVSAGVNMSFITNRVFRDVSAWYHILAIVDTTDSTAGDRQQIYINGVRETSFGTSTTFAEDDAAELGATDKDNIVGRHGADDDYFDGYMAEHVFIDGLALAPTSFGEFDEDSGIWKPLESVADLTFGNNGYYLDFKASGNLGNDANGGTDLAESGLAAIDQTTDTCTNNFATINALDNYFAVATLTEGNLKVTCNAGNTSFITATFGLSKGKWYWEGKLTTVGGEEAIGITDKNSTATDNYAGQTANSYSFKGNNGDIRNADENANYGSAYGASVIGVYMDLDNNKLYFAINGSIQNSGTGVSITAVASTTNGFYFPMVGDVDSDAPVWEVNFGNPVSALTSAVSDAKGFGAFEYDPSAGTFDSASKSFLAICTKNLATNG
jgi:hypothetical protein